MFGDTFKTMPLRGTGGNQMQENNKKQFIVGVDYSITSPSITIQTYSTVGGLLRLDSVMIAQSKKQCLNDALCLKYDDIEWHFHLLEIEDETVKETPELRYHSLAQKLFNKMIEIIGEERENIKLGIEDYSFGANGRITDIAECTSVFKQICYQYFKQPIIPIAPTTIKKHYTGKGNANKIMMYQTLLTHTNQDIMEKFNNIKHFDIDNPKCKIPAPLGDVVDGLACAFSLKKVLDNQ